MFFNFYKNQNKSILFETSEKKVKHEDLLLSSDIFWTNLAQHGTRGFKWIKC